VVLLFIAILFLILFLLFFHTLPVIPVACFPLTTTKDQ